METNKWINELPEITKPCIIICAKYNTWRHWDYNLFEIDDQLRVLQDGDWWGEIDELHADKYMIIDLPKKEKV